MKKIVFFFVSALVIAGCGKEFDDSAINGRIDSFEQRLSDMETLMRAYENNLFIKTVQKTNEGYTLTFSDGSKVTVENGKDGRDGVDGKDGANGKDGIDGKDGADGKDGINGKDGKDGTDGKDGANGKDGDTLIDSIIISETMVTFILTDGRQFSIPIGEGVQFSLSLSETEISVKAGDTKTVSYTITGAMEKPVITVLSQDNWKAKINSASETEGTIIITAPNPAEGSEIVVLANDGAYRTLMVSIKCNMDEEGSNDDDLIGGEDVTDPRLNPGGILMDHGINIVGAWATPFGTNPTNVLQFFLLDSQGNVIHYWDVDEDEDEYLTMDSNGFIHGSFSDFEEGKYTEYRKDPVFSMLELVCVIGEYDHDIYRYCPWDDDGPILTNYSYDDYLRDSKHKKTIDEKQGKVVCSWIDYHNYNCNREIVVKAKDVDSFIVDVKEDTYYDGQSSETLILRRVKGFTK